MSVSVEVPKEEDEEGRAGGVKLARAGWSLILTSITSRIRLGVKIVWTQAPPSHS